MRIVIIGAGLAGSVAAGAFSIHNPEVYEARAEDSGPEHKALMRLRDPAIANYLGVSLEKITVHKAVSWGGHLYESADLRMNNLYSLKTYGELGVRSLKDMGEAKRYLLLDQPKPANVEFRQELVRVDEGFLTFGKVDGDYGSGVDYDICISTIPLPYMIKITGMSTGVEFTWKPIHVVTAQLNLESNVHQTIYFPEPSNAAYRATVQGKHLIIESTDKNFNLLRVLEAFGLEVGDIDNSTMRQHEQRMGKMLSIPEHERRRLIYELTDKYGIYSLGRFAIWKPIRADHLIKDVEKIKRMINLTHSEMNYERRLNS